MAKKIRVIIFIIIGVISIGLSIKCFSYRQLDYEAKSMYGGDAFTGIQNAGAQTSKNVRDLADIVKFGFGSVLLVSGLGFLGVGLTTPLQNSSENEDDGNEESLGENPSEETTSSESEHNEETNNEYA